MCLKSQWVSEKIILIKEWRGWGVVIRRGILFEGNLVHVHVHEEYMIHLQPYTIIVFV